MAIQGRPRPLRVIKGGGEPPAIDEASRRLVDLVLRWAPFGGPPDEDLFPMFGITRRDLLGRITDIVERFPQLAQECGSQLLCAARAEGTLPSSYCFEGLFYTVLRF